MSRPRLGLLAGRNRIVVAFALATGALTGAAVAAFDWLTAEVLLHHVYRWPVWGQALAPGAGLVAAAACLRWLANGASPATSDEYIRNFHERDRRLDLRPFAGRVAASIATLGSGGAMGFEGPSIYLGAGLGSALQRRFSRLFSREDAKVLLVAGAAAGVAAIFKAPATGVVFALEAPFRDDLARRMLLPASISAAASYVTFAVFAGTNPILGVSGSPPFDLKDLGGAVAVGLLAGAGARAFVVLAARAKRFAAAAPVALRLALAAAALAALVVASDAVFDQPLANGPGYRAITWALDPSRGVPLLLALFAVRMLATAATIAGGGVGGTFVPLVVLGALLGRILDGVFSPATETLFPMIGVAAFLGAGYRVPLAAVMFVAESTGRPGFVVPGLIAAVVAQLPMGRHSISPYQVATRAGHLERRFALPIAAAMRTDVLTATPDTTMSELFWNHIVTTRQRSVPVLDGARFVGMVRVEDMRDVPRDEWETATVERIVRRDVPCGRPSWTLRDAIVAMEEGDIDRLPVLDDAGRFVGVVTTSQILSLDEVLGEAEGDHA